MTKPKAKRVAKLAAKTPAGTRVEKKDSPKARKRSRVKIDGSGGAELSKENTGIGSVTARRTEVDGSGAAELARARIDGSGGAEL